jgi:hypothetical protein
MTARLHTVRERDAGVGGGIDSPTDHAVVVEGLTKRYGSRVGPGSLPWPSSRASPGRAGIEDRLAYCWCRTRRANRVRRR